MKTFTKLFFSVLLVSTTITSKAQIPTYLWAQNTVDYGQCIELDASGNVYTMTSNYNMGVTKYNSVGTVLWNFTIAGSGTMWGTEMKIDQTGSVYVFVGLISGSADFDPGAGVATLNAGKILVKYDASGVYQWGFSIPEVSNISKEYMHLATDNNNNVYIASDFSGSIDFDPGSGTTTLSTGGGGDEDVFFAKYTSAGNMVWAKNIGIGGSSYDWTNGIEINNNNGDVILVAYIGCSSIWSQGDLDPGPGVVGAYCQTYYLIRYDSLGNYLSNRYLPNPDYRYEETAMDSNGNIFLAGAVPGGGGSFSFGVTNLYSFGGRTLFIAKLDCTNNGAEVFAVEEGYATTNNLRLGDLFVDSGDNVYLIASNNCTSSFIDFCKFSPTGTNVFSVQLTAGTDCTSPNGEGIASNGFEIYVTTLNSGYVIDFDNGTGVANYPTSSNYGAIAKYSFCTSSPAHPSAITGNSLVCETVSYLYSVPMDANATSYSWTAPVGWSGTSTSNTIMLTPNTGASSGNITVSADNSCGASTPQTFVATVNVCTGINQLTTDDEQVIIFPNPTTGELIISFFDKLRMTELGIIEVSVSNVLGECVYKSTICHPEHVEGQQLTIDLSKQSNGIYFIKITNENNSTVKKIIKL